ncbi:MAG: hypothetical protein ABI273_02340 [Lacunisphaera sp.]
MNDDDLKHFYDGVDSKEKFIGLVAALRRDLELSREEEASHPSSPYGPNARGWENPDLGRYLEAMADWLESADNYYQYPARSNRG